jgi:hypothetical protein
VGTYIPDIGIENKSDSNKEVDLEKRVYVLVSLIHP